MSSRCALGTLAQVQRGAGTLRKVHGLSLELAGFLDCHRGGTGGQRGLYFLDEHIGSVDAVQEAVERRSWARCVDRFQADAEWAFGGSERVPRTEVRLVDAV